MIKLTIVFDDLIASRANKLEKHSRFLKLVLRFTSSLTWYPSVTRGRGGRLLSGALSIRHFFFFFAFRCLYAGHFNLSYALATNCRALKLEEKQRNWFASRTYSLTFKEIQSSLFFDDYKLKISERTCFIKSESKSVNNFHAFFFFMFLM